MEYTEEIKETLVKINEFIQSNNEINYKIRLLEREVPNLQELVKKLLVNRRYSYSEIEERLKSQIDDMIQCVQDSQGTIDPSDDINNIEITLKVLKHVYMCANG